MPGSLTQAQFDVQADQASTPDDFGALDSERVTAFAERRIGNYELVAELSHVKKVVDATYVSTLGTSANEYTSRQTQFSPRLRRTDRLGGTLNEVVAGLDLMRWSRVTASDFSQVDASQNSRAVYVRDEVRFGGAPNARIAVGVRHETFDKESLDPAAFSHANYRSKQQHNAWEIQGSVAALAQLILHLKAGQSYRVPNADENGFTATPDTPLEGQSSHDLELGATLGGPARSLTVRWFRHNLANEIFFDPTSGALGGYNVNLDPTRREGMELDGTIDLAPGWRLSGHAQHIKASSRDGPNAGKEMVLVPKNVITARLGWTPAAGHSADLGALRLLSCGTQILA